MRKTALVALALSTLALGGCDENSVMLVRSQDDMERAIRSLNKDYAYTPDMSYTSKECAYNECTDDDIRIVYNLITTYGDIEDTAETVEQMRRVCNSISISELCSSFMNLRDEFNAGLVANGYIDYSESDTYVSYENMDSNISSLRSLDEYIYALTDYNERLYILKGDLVSISIASELDITIGEMLGVGYAVRAFLPYLYV